MSKNFKIKDKSGRDGIVHVPKEFLLQQESDVGDTWETHNLEIAEIHIKEVIKENTVIHCETEEEANRVLGMAHTLGYKWWYGKGYEDNTEWYIYKSKMCYDLFEGSYSHYDYFNSKNHTIIPSTQIADLDTGEIEGYKIVKL